VNIDIAAAAAVFAAAAAAAGVAWPLLVDAVGRILAAAAAAAGGRALGQRRLVTAAASDRDQEGHRYLRTPRGQRLGGCCREQSKDGDKALRLVETGEREVGAGRRLEEGRSGGWGPRCFPRRPPGARRPRPRPWLWRMVGLLPVIEGVEG